MATSVPHVIIINSRICPVVFTRSKIAVRSSGPDTDFWYVWPWPWRYTSNLYPRSWHTLGPLTSIVWNTCIIQIQHGNEELAGHGFCYDHTLTWEVWPWSKVITHPWIMDNNSVKYPEGVRSDGHDLNRQTDEISIYLSKVSLMIRPFSS